MPDPVSLRERVGGRWAVSWPYAAFVTIAPALTFPYAVPVSGGDGAPLLMVMGIVAAANLVAALLVPAAAVTVFRHRRRSPVPVWAVFALGVAIAVARDLLVRPALAAFDLRIDGTVPLRLLALAVLSGFVAVGFALVLDEIDRLRRTIHGLNEELVRLREQERLGDELIESIELAAETEITAATSAVLDGIDGRVAVDSMGATTALRTFVETRLRPLSAELYELEEAPVPQLQVRDALRIGLRSRPIRPGVTALLVGVFVLIYQLPRFPLAEALVQGATHAALLFVVLAAVSLAARRGLIHGAAIPLAVVLAVATTTAKVLLLQGGGTILGSGILIANGAWVASAVLAVVLLDALFTGRTAALPVLRATLDDTAIETIVERRELVRVSRDLAGYVHGTLQSTLLAAAFAIEDATRTGDEERVTRALADARVALRDLALPVPETVTDLAAELRRRADQWRGYLAVAVAVDCPYPLSPATIRTASAIGEEALVNARKHGHAAHVWISATMAEPGLLELTIRDDGTGPREGARGVGSRQLDAAAPGAWTLAANPDGRGAILEATIIADRLSAPLPVR
ncbi:MAG: hypothetical protein NWS62_02320 [Gaiellales bacterium]|jgi:signal transduction histidine kinase|nr:hypothetical protein [Gaiellales bacterium]